MCPSCGLAISNVMQQTGVQKALLYKTTHKTNRHNYTENKSILHKYETWALFNTNGAAKFNSIGLLFGNVID